MSKWERPTQAPPPLFLGEKEKNLVKQVNDEIIERVVGQQVLYFPIDVENTDFHPLYGVYALVTYNGVETADLDNLALDKSTKITVNFHKRRLTEDQNLFVREGDFVRFGPIYYEIVKLNEPKLLFGQPESRFEISADCIRARDGLFNAE